MAAHTDPSVAIVLPPREGFSPDASGAVGLMVHRLASAPSSFQVAVFGGRVAGTPYSDVAFRPMRPSWLPGRRNLRYAAAVAGALRQLRPALVEVHNRPEVALALAASLPASRVSLFLHNDPQGMRQAGSAAARADLLRGLAGVSCVSDYLKARLLEGIAAPPKNPVVLPNCLDLSAVPAPPAQRDAMVLFAGRVVADKGADSFVAAWAQARSGMAGWRRS